MYLEIWTQHHHVTLIIENTIVNKDPVSRYIVTCTFSFSYLLCIEDNKLNCIDVNLALKPNKSYHSLIQLNSLLE